MVSLPPSVRGPARARAATHRPGGTSRPAHDRRRVAGRTRASGRGDSARPGGRELGLATRLLADNWFGLYLDGRLATARELLSRFPAGMVSGESGTGGARRPGSDLEGRWMRQGGICAGESHVSLGTRRSSGALPGRPCVHAPVCRQSARRPAGCWRSGTTTARLHGYHAGRRVRAQGRRPACDDLDRARDGCCLGRSI